MNGAVLTATRRFCTVLIESGEQVFARQKSGQEAVVTGDQITIQQTEDQYLVESILDRRNTLSRSLGNKTKTIATNVDHLFLVTSPQPEAPFEFLDRVIVAASTETIPVSIIFNKIDLKQSVALKNLQQTYLNSKIHIFPISAHSGEGFENFMKTVENKDNENIAFIGISGVGKSTILNHLLPEADREIGDLSKKSGQGRQTTTLAAGFPFLNSQGNQQIIIDLPGIQRYGLSSLDRSQIQEGFAEVQKCAAECKFQDCSHIAEESCAVIAAVQNGEIPESRYQSYQAIYEEVERHKDY